MKTHICRHPLHDPDCPFHCSPLTDEARANLDEVIADFVAHCRGATVFDAMELSLRCNGVGGTA